MDWKELATRSLNEVLNGVETTAYTIVEHPWYCTVGAMVGSIVALRLYSRYSIAMCSCATDSTGKIVVITGGNAGIGKAVATELARHNATVIIGCRSNERGKQAVKDITEATGNQKVSYRILDLCSFASVRKFADTIKQGGSLHILINNAGVTGSGGRQITEDGCEHIMQANYFGHFLLTMSLIDVLKSSAHSRIINVSSLVYKWGKLDLNDLQTKKRYNPTEIYNKSKLANVLFTKELAKRLAKTGVTVNAVNPGVVKTDIVRNTPSIDAFITKLLFGVVGKTPLQGAQTILHVAMAPELENVSGQYFSDCKKEKLVKIAEDETFAKKLFEKSESIVRLDMKS